MPSLTIIPLLPNPRWQSCRLAQASARFSHMLLTFFSKHNRPKKKQGPGLGGGGSITSNELRKCSTVCCSCVALISCLLLLPLAGLAVELVALQVTEAQIATRILGRGGTQTDFAASTRQRIKLASKSKRSLLNGRGDLPGLPTQTVTLGMTKHDKQAVWPKLGL